MPSSWRSQTESRQTESRQTGAITIGAVLALAAVTVLSLIGAGTPAARADLARGTIWLANLANGTTSHVNGYSGKRDGQVKATNGHGFTVVQREDGAYLVDNATGAVSRLDGSTMTTTNPVKVFGKGVRLATGGGHTWEVMPATGQAVEVDPMTLKPLGAVIPLGGAVSGDVVADAQGRLWAHVPGTGSVTRVNPGGTVSTTDVGNAKDVVGLTIASGTALAYNSTGGKVVDLGTGWTAQVPKSAGDKAVIGGDPDGTVAVVVGDKQATGLRVGDGVIASVPLSSTTAITKAVVAGTTGYLLDSSEHKVRIVNLVKKTSEPLDFTPTSDVISRDKMVFVNDLSGANAAVVDSSGRTVKVEKYTEASTKQALTRKSAVDQPLPPQAQPPVQQRRPSATATSSISTQPSHTASAKPSQTSTKTSSQSPTQSPTQSGTQPPTQSGTQSPTGSLSESPTGSPSDSPSSPSDSASSPSSPSTPNDPTPGPGKVEQLTASAGDRSVSLTWAQATNAAGYQIAIEPAVNGYPRTVTQTSAVVKSLTPGTPYTFIVRAENRDGERGAPARATATPQERQQPTQVRVPSAVRGLVSGADGATSLYAEWNSPADNGGEKIDKYRVTAIAQDGTQAGRKEVSGKRAVIGGLKAATMYTVSVEAHNSAGYGPAEAASLSTSNALPQGSDLRLTAGTTSIDYTVEIWARGSASTCQIAVNGEIRATPACGNGIINGTVDGLTPGTAYTITVTATNTFGPAKVEGQATTKAVPEPSTSTTPPAAKPTATVDPGNRLPSWIYNSDKSGDRSSTRLPQGTTVTLRCSLTWQYAGGGQWYWIEAGANHPEGLVLQEEFTSRPTVPGC